MIENPEALERLERRVARLGAIATMLAVGFIVLLAWQLVPRPEWRARSYALHGRDGVPRAALYLREDDTPALRLNGPDGRARAMVLVRADGSVAVRLSDAAGEHRAQLALDPAGEPALRLAGPDGRTRTSLGLAAASGPALVAHDASGRIVLRAP
jgi:hypothetical protein